MNIAKLLSFAVIFVGGMLNAREIPQALQNDSHDIISLDRWGPYSKQYAGISHIADIESGEMVDFTVIPGYYRRSYSIPNVLYESGYHPWKVTPDMKSITYRYELEWKDMVYADVRYDILDSCRVRVSINCVNNTDIPQSLLFHNTVSLHYNDNHPIVKAEGGKDAIILYGCDYECFEPAVKTHAYNLVYDGRMRGEELDRESLNGSVLGQFGKNAGDAVTYNIVSIKEIEDAKITIRCKVGKGKDAKLEIDGIVDSEISIRGTGRYEMVSIGCNLARGNNYLKLRSTDCEKIKIDAIIAGTAETVDNIRIVSAPLEFKPEETVRNHKDFMVRYNNVCQYYAIAWNSEHAEIKEYANSDLDVFMRRSVHKHPDKYYNGNQKGHFTSAYIRPVVLDAHTDTTIIAMLAAGTRETVEKAIADFHQNNIVTEQTPCSDREGGYLPESKEFMFGNQLLEATLLTNVVYPVYTQKEQIRHFTPGKNWNSLYTWDLGCIAMAMTAIDSVKAFEIIRAYTTGEDSQSAYIHHGTPLPIHFFAFSELDNLINDNEAIDFLYPRLKKWYDYMVGRDKTSTTMMKSGLIRTWDYFYNSGGWDDYPPQHRLRSQKDIYSRTTPVVSTAYYLRAAKILRMYAEKAGNRKDIQIFDKDIKLLSEAIQEYAWDEDAGYYSYVIHNENGMPDKIYRHEDGSNYNKGLDGVTPLIAGCCSKEQTERLLDNIFSPEKMWTSVGISTVDRSARYYDPNGYWNGSVWVPHEYFIWKALLDCNRPELAEKLAFTALEAWEKECNTSYNCIEHFNISSGRGAGWHNFSGLSSPMVNFFNNYFKIGHISTGFDASVDKKSFNETSSSLDAVIRFDKGTVGEEKALIVCMSPDCSYEVLFNGQKINAVSPYKGLLYISVCATGTPGQLTIRPVI